MSFHYYNPEGSTRYVYLGLRIPYTVGDENREYQPAFIVKTKDVNLVVQFESEINDYISPDQP